MNIQHLKVIADQLKFKLTAEMVEQIPTGPGGGHLCWKIKSENETFFIKQLDPRLDVKDKKIIARYELCESVAFRFAQQGILAVHAIKNNDKAVMVIENNAYLVYPWIEGYTLKNEISAKQAVKVAETIAKIHDINLNVPEIEPKLDVHPNEKIVACLEKAIASEKSVSKLLIKNQDMILSMNDRYLSTIALLKEKTVITHGDIFPHNVIWQEPGLLFLIDWEAVKNMNPTREIIRACLAWGRVDAEPHSLSLFEKMLKIYINFGGPLEKNHVEAALNGMYGNTIHWLLYNIDLVIGGYSDARKRTAINEINNSLEASVKITKLYSLLYNSIMQTFFDE